MKIIGLAMALSLGFGVCGLVGSAYAADGSTATTGIFRDLENAVDSVFQKTNSALDRLHKKLVSDSSAPTAVSAETTLRNVRDVAHRLMRESMYLINDVEQRDMVVTGEPMLIQPQDVFANDKRSIGWAQEAFDLGPAQQPRPKWINSDMAHMKQLIDLLREDMKATPQDDQQAEVDSAWSEANAIAKEIEAHYDKLVDLTKGPKYENIQIGKEALGIYDAAKRLEKPWTNTLRAVKTKAK